MLTDFGIAALPEATRLTATGDLIGSPEFIAPERIRGEEGDPASDLWSLAMPLYVAIEGHSPLRRATSMATLVAVLDEPIPPPVRSGPLASVLTAVLQRDPALRPDAEQLERMFADAEDAPSDRTAAYGVGPVPAPTPTALPHATQHTPPPPDHIPPWGRAAPARRPRRRGGLRTVPECHAHGRPVPAGPQRTQSRVERQTRDRPHHRGHRPRRDTVGHASRPARRGDRPELPRTVSEGFRNRRRNR